MAKRAKLEKPEFALGDGLDTLVFALVEQDGEAILNVQGVIGDRFDGVSAAQVVPEIQQTDIPIRMRLNTPGGFVDEALDVQNALFEHPHKVTADIVGMAWSAGTILSAAADEVRISSAAPFGIHRCWSGFILMGNAEELEDQAKGMESKIESLIAMDAAIAEMLADRSGNTVKQVHDWMIGPDGSDGTEFIGQAAVDAGFADSVIPNKKKAAANNQLRREARARSCKRLADLARRRAELADEVA